MPLYTYVLTHNGRTVVVQERRSNFRGWMVQVIARAFPGLPKRDLQTAWEIDPQSAPNLSRVWRGSTELGGSPLDVTIVETRD